MNSILKINIRHLVGLGMHWKTSKKLLLTFTMQISHVRDERALFFFNEQ